MPKRIILLGLSLLALTGTTYLWINGNHREEPQAVTVVVTEAVSATTPPPTATPARRPESNPIEDSPLKEAVIAAGDYLARQQLANGELAYQVNILNNERAYAPSHLRLMAGTGALFTVCRVSGDAAYCAAGDRALGHYLGLLVSDPQAFKGACLYTNGACPLGGAALTVDAIYKRWQATGGLMLGERDLLDTAAELGYFIVSMRKPNGGFYHSFDPHFGGAADSNYFSASFSGGALSALLQLHEMTGNDFWLKQAHEVNEYMIAQSATEDYRHSYALALLAKREKLDKAEQAYAREVADTIIAGQVRSLHPVNSSVSTATKIEALAALAQAFYLSGADHAWLEREIRAFITFVQARQLPQDNCNFSLGDDAILRYRGGVFASCEDPSIRVDGVQHWIEGVTLFLEYRAMSGAK